MKLAFTTVGCALAASAFTLAATACGTPSETAGSGGKGNLVPGGFDAGGTGGAAGTTAAPVPAQFVASFIAETAPGDGPAFVTFHNQTPNIQSLWLAGAEFIEVPAGTTRGPELTASATVEQDTTTGKHENDRCVAVPLKGYSGPSALSPGKHYVMAITPDGPAYLGDLTETTGDPFVAVRVRVQDSAATPFDAARVALDLGAPGGPTQWSIFDAEPTRYVLAGTDSVTLTVQFEGAAGGNYAGTAPVTLAGAPGYTVVIAEQQVPGATQSIVLPRSD